MSHFPPFVLGSTQLIKNSLGYKKVAKKTKILCHAVVVYLDTGPWGVSYLLDGDVPASDSDPSVPRLHHYLLRKLLYSC